MHNPNLPLDENLIDETFSRYQGTQNNVQQTPHSKKPIGNKMIIESDSDDELMNAMNARDIQNTVPKIQHINNQSRKKAPQNISEVNQKTWAKTSIQVQTKQPKLLTFSQLAEQFQFYFTQVYQFSYNKLFVTGVMQNGQTINIVANQTYRQLYFALRNQDSQSQQISQDFKKKAKKQIDQKLRKQKIDIFAGQFVDKQYVFELDGVCRQKRPYYKVRFSFQKYKEQQLPKPDWEGQYFRYVFGTTYTPLQLFILNTRIKGPSWVKVDKNQLKQTSKNTEGHLCAEIINVQTIETNRNKTKPPTLRVMSISLKAAIPSHLSKKQLFPNTNRIDESHIYCISYTFCEQYQVELKPINYNSIQRTFYLQSFGNMEQKSFSKFQNQSKMIGQFLADVNRLDPDVLVCHDSSNIIDVLIQRISQTGDKNTKPKLGRLIHYYNLNSSNQQQRISSAIAGRLLVDTFIHSKDMIKSIDYELQSMARNIKPQKNFVGMTDQQVKDNLQTNKTLIVLKKVREEAETTFALMNHLQVLQLSRNLSTICGNLWKRSLQNQRAQRNEYLIMHECIKRDLIIPDKFRTFRNDQDAEQGDRKKFTGGMVIQPKKGMYNDFIILLDFNSLYPSIIREYNVCFSVLERPRLPLAKFYKAKKLKGQNKKGQKTMQDVKQLKEQHKNEDQDTNIQPPSKELCTKQKWGFLPNLINTIVNQRLKCKKAMKTATPQKCIILDIQQKSYKIVANSIYGCLGFRISRFYSKPMAALITRMGRQALQKANDIVSARGGVQVIYGDTDSLMIQPTSLSKQTDFQKLFQIQAIASDLKKSINKQYHNLQIDIDGIYKPIILLMKKKYVANKLQNFDKIIAGIQTQLKFNLEFKGIQVVRRDGCEVARASLKRILEILMTSNKSDVFQVYELIYDYARQLKEKLPTIPDKDFLFTKQLNKKPSEYLNKEQLPHVKVAMDRIRNGEKEQTLVNHTMYYMVCKPKLQSQDSLASRCFDNRTFERLKKQATDPSQILQIDIQYYKKEILQPWMRIFMNLEQFNADKLFEAFDVKDADRKSIKKTMNSEKDGVDNGLQDYLTNDMKEKSLKFNEQIKEFKCSNCQNTMPFAQDGVIKTRCKYCPLDNTNQMISSLSNNLSSWLKQKSALYYSNKQKCQCGKVYLLSLISKCCRSNHDNKSTIPFQIHTFIYLAKELIQVKIKMLHELIAKKLTDIQLQQMENAVYRLRKINQDVLGKFLEQSDFENIKGLFDMFRI